jgi:hypothetical protein
MTTPHRQIHYVSASELEALYVEHQFDHVLANCGMRPILDEVFNPTKATHPGTVMERGAVYTDTTGLRAVIFHYTHSDGRIVRSIKRLVTDTIDYRLPQPAATPDSKSSIFSIRNQQIL